MTELYTEFSLLRHAYQELDFFTKLEIEIALEEDSTLMDAYESILLQKRCIPHISLSPKKDTIKNLLAYSL